MESNIKKRDESKCEQNKSMSFLVVILMILSFGTAIGKLGSVNSPETIQVSSNPKVEHILTPVSMEPVGLMGTEQLSTIQNSKGPHIWVYNSVINNVVVSSKDMIQNVISRSEQRHQIECIAKNIYYESRNQPYSGQVAVAMVTLNRAETQNKSPCSVVYEHNDRGCQFTWTCTHTHNEQYKPSQEEWHQSLVIAYICYFKMVEDVTGGAMWYYNPKIAHPHWLKNMLPCSNKYIMNGYLGDHRFYKPKPELVALN